MGRDTTTNQDVWLKEQNALIVFQMSVLEKTPLELVLNSDQTSNAGDQGTNMKPYQILQKINQNTYQLKV